MDKTNIPGFYRLEEIATASLHKLLEIDEELAREFFEELDLEDYEYEYFGIKESEEI